MVSKLSWFFNETRKRSPVLWNLIVVQLVFISISIVGIFLDPRLIKSGISPWQKPIIFDTSVIIYVVSMIWVVSELPKDLNRKYSRGIALSLLIVTSFIIVQSVRGVKTVFTFSDPLNSTIFVIFGLAIALNTFLLFKISFYMNREANAHIPPIYKRGIQLGLWAVIIGSLIGHAVYFSSIHFDLLARIATDDAKLSSLSLYSRFGGLRIAHSLGLHGLQLFMFLGAAFQFRGGKVDEQRAINILNRLFKIVMIVMALMLLWATLGISYLSKG